MKGLYTVKGHTGLALLTVINTSPGNGHLEDVFQWFEFSARKAKTNLLVIDVMNARFGRHLMEKRGFHPIDKENFYKILT